MTSNQSRPGSQGLTVLAFGTSVMWGDGLRQENTFRYQVTDWIAAQTNRTVTLATFAHSGALLNTPTSSVTPNPAPSVGDLNSSLPSVDQQIECASGMGDLSSASLILVEGCINDVGAESIVYPWTETPKLENETDISCGPPMSTELKKIHQMFPEAVVVTVGYYPLVSSRSSIFGFSGTRRLAKHAGKLYVRKHPSALQQSKKHRPRKEEHDILVVNSEAFYQHSKKALEDATGELNSASQSKFFFATLPEVRLGEGTTTVDPLFAYGAPLRHEWMIPIRFLFFWAFYKDQKYWPRQSLCAKYVQLGIERLVCDSNPAFHPDVQGAKVYAESVENTIPRDTVNGWKAQ